AALEGNSAAAKRYVRLWRNLAEIYLHSLRAERPDLVVESQGQIWLIDVKGMGSPGSSLIWEAAALEAPFSSWVARTPDVGTAVCSLLLQRVRESLPDFEPVELGEHGLPHWDLSGEEVRLFTRNVLASLASAELPLERIRAVFELNVTELGELFGVTRQAARQWLDDDVPANRKAKVATVVQIAELLQHKLRSGVVAGVARKPADAYEGLSALEMIKRDRHEELLESIRRAFDWAVPA
ncbi:MAG: hypothetical protein ACRDWA_03015, partial [Acidimicrobiia bacterium]